MTKQIVEKQLDIVITEMEKLEQMDYLTDISYIGEVFSHMTNILRYIRNEYDGGTQDTLYIIKKIQEQAHWVKQYAKCLEPEPEWRRARKNVV
jgi:hypothetical protein